MYFPRPEERIKPPAPVAAPGGQPNAPGPAMGAPGPGGMPPLPNVSGFRNPHTGQSNNFAPIPPDEIKRWAELNHVSKGAIKQVEWSQNTGQYLMTMKDGDIQKVAPEYVMQNQGHWAPHPDHAMAAVHFIAANKMRQALPMILNAMRQRQGGGGSPPTQIGRPMGGSPPSGPPSGVPPTPMTPMASAATQMPVQPVSGA